MKHINQELLEALRDLLAETQKLWGRPATLIKFENKATIAIAKATGRDETTTEPPDESDHICPCGDVDCSRPTNHVLEES